MADRPTLFDVPLPPGLNRDQRLQIADLIIEEIKERAERGIDKNGQPFKKAFKGPYKGRYTKEYAESLDFAVAGKSTSPINLTLSGDMLASLALVKDRKDKLTIGYRKADPEEQRAEGNILGTYGNPRPVAPRRDFLGLPPTVLARIIREAAGTTKTPGLLDLIRAQLVASEPGVS